MIPIADLNSTPGNTPLDADHAAQLIPDISTKRELDQFERLNILAAQKWAFDSRVMKKRDPLDEPYIRELHERMFNETWEWAGKYRQIEVSMGCDPHQIITEVGTLLGDVRFWIKHDSYDLDEIAVRFHHRLVGRIHAFPDGNGRHARMIAEVLLVKRGRPRFGWAGGNLSNHDAKRDAYITALRKLDADNSAVQPLLTFARS